MDQIWPLSSFILILSFFSPFISPLHPFEFSSTCTREGSPKYPPSFTAGMLHTAWGFKVLVLSGHRKIYFIPMGKIQPRCDMSSFNKGFVSERLMNWTCYCYLLHFPYSLFLPLSFWLLNAEIIRISYSRECKNKWNYLWCFTFKKYI